MSAPRSAPLGLDRIPQKKPTRPPDRHPLALEPRLSEYELLGLRAREVDRGHRGIVGQGGQVTLLRKGNLKRTTDPGYKAVHEVNRQNLTGWAVCP
jgi:hypothetical protein